MCLYIYPYFWSFNNELADLPGFAKEVKGEQIVN